MDLSSLTTAFSGGAGGLSSSDAPSSSTGSVSFGNNIIGAKNQMGLGKMIVIGMCLILALAILKKKK